MAGSADKTDELEKAVAAAEVKIKDLSERLDASIKSGEQKEKDLAALRRILSGSHFLRTFLSFFSSGVFFMIVGALMLVTAFQTMGGTHTSFTFVLVVVGVAVLLYGTGTQSAGEAVSGKVKVYLAGGAGVLAFLVAYGIVEKSPEIKAAFQVEKKYFRYLVVAADDGVTDLSNYVALADIGGDQVPAMRRGNYIEVYVPYFDKLLEGTNPVAIKGMLELYRVKDGLKQQLNKEEKLNIIIDPREPFLTDDGSYEFPRLRGEPQLVSTRIADNLDSSSTDKAQVPPGVLPPPPVIGAPE